MGAYHYQALTKNGSSSKGVIEADSERQARQLLRDQGLLPTKIKTLAKKSQGHKDKISSEDLSLLTQQLATLLSAGIPVEESLLGLSEQTEKIKLREIIMGLRAKILQGYSLAQAMHEFPYAFPELYRATVAAGEHSGCLDLVLVRLAEYTERQRLNRQKIQQALIYPSLMLFISVSIIGFLLAFVVPKMIEVFTESEQSLPQMTVVLVSMSHFIQAYGFYVLMGMGLILFAWKKSLERLRIKLLWHRILLKLPLIRYLIKTSNVARYIHTFGILFSAGVNVLETMRVSSRLINNLIMRKAFETAGLKVREGAGISLALKDTGFLSPMVIHLITSGEKSGRLGLMMEKAAIELDNQVKRLIDTGLTLLEPMVILFMGAMVLFIVLATLLPIFSMQQLVS